MTSNEVELDVAGEPYPPWVSPAARLRWDMARLAASLASASNEHGRANVAFVWYAARQLFNNEELELGPEEDVVRLVSRARELGLEVFLASELEAADPP